MTQPIDLNDIEGRPARYWQEDGVPELVMGLMWILWGGAWLIGAALPRGGAWNVYWLLTPALLALSGVAAVGLIKRVKARVTFPRTGYVAWKAPTAGQRMLAASVAMVTAVALVWIVARGRAAGLEGIAAPAIGVILSLGFLVTSIRQRAPHLLALGGVALALGVVFGLLGQGFEAMNWMFVILGAVATTIGAARLRMFLARHPLGAHE
jgi:hypothetical protein